MTRFVPPARLAAVPRSRAKTPAMRASAPSPPSIAGTYRITPSAGAANSVRAEADAATRASDALSGPGEPLAPTQRTYFEPRFGRDLSGVRVHHDRIAQAGALGIGAAAYTLGAHIGFAPDRFAPESAPGRALLAHELAHVTRQSDAGEPQTIRRRLLIDGAPDDVQGLLDIISPPSGLILFQNPPTAEVDGAGATPGIPRSLSLASQLIRIINDQRQNAEIHVGQAQPKVLVGAFPGQGPGPSTGIQRVDLDDIRALEAGAPGNGVAAAAHEIEENYQAHGAPGIPGFERFDASHERAIESESNVAEELVGPGRRTARRILTDTSSPLNPQIHAIDYQNYYLIVESTGEAGTENQIVSRAARERRIEVSSRTIDHFNFNMAGVPASGRSELGAAVGEVQANPLSTITIVGHADSIGSDEVNVGVSARRAEQTRDAMIGAGVEPGREKERFHVEGHGEAEPVADNDTPEGRAENRRVVISVTKPERQPPVPSSGP